MNDNKFLPKLSQNLLEILNDNEYYDITIEVGEDPYVKIFRAHMVILNYRSPYLRRILSSKKKNDGNLAHIKFPNILPETFQIILRYIYGGKLSLKEYDASVIIKILVAANELNLQELVIHLQSSLVKNNANWMEQNFEFVHKTSFENDSFLELQKYCIYLISKNPDKIFKSPNFSSISEKLLVKLIRSDNLHMGEVQIWEHMLNWGMAQNPELPSDPKEFSKNDFNSLKNTLQKCIPFIKFFNFTNKEFLDKVYPYRKILPKDLRENLVTHFLNRNEPSNKPESKIINEIVSKNIDSKIITFRHFELISKWIDNLEISDKEKNSYEFKLILRGSRDGFRSKKFHEICDNQSHTITIIKVEGSNEILGGYSPIEWKPDFSYGITKDGFIFSFKNDKVENYILSRVGNDRYAIYNHPNCGPSFGIGDFTLYGNNSYSQSYCRKCAYLNQIRETEDYFSVEEYEVFQIVKL